MRKNSRRTSPSSSPRTDGQVGTLAYHLYEAEGVEEPTDDPAIAVYTPYGYDAGREEPYKVLYISHGGGVESETSWVNKGSVCNVMDNLIADYGVEPFVLVIINNYAVGFDADNLVDNIVPLVEGKLQRLHRARRQGPSPACRWAAPSRSTRSRTIPADFGYYGVFSGGYFGTYADGELEDMGIDAEALKDAHIYLAAGSKEFGLLANPERLRRAQRRGRYRLSQPGVRWRPRLERLAPSASWISPSTNCGSKR